MILAVHTERVGY